MKRLELILQRGRLAAGLLPSCAMVFLSACTPDSDDSLSGPQATARGKQVFDYHCGYCHDADGRGPSLSEITALSKVERRNRIINHPIAGQIPQRLQANEISDLNQFFDSQSSTGDLPTSED